MAKKDIKIHIVSSADLKALDAAEGKLKSVANTAKSSYAKVGDFVTKTRSFFEKFNSVFSLFGFVNAIMSIVRVFTALHNWLSQSKKKAEEFARAIQDSKNEKAIQKSVNAYKALNEQIDKFNKAQQLRNQLAEQANNTRRGVEYAQLDVEEAKAHAAVPLDDPDAQLKHTLISNEFAVRRAKLDRQNAWQDRTTEQGELYDERDQNIKLAKEKDAFADKEWQVGYDLSATRAKLYNEFFHGLKPLSEMSDKQREHWDKLVKLEKESAEREKKIRDDAAKHRELAKVAETKAAALKDTEFPAILKAEATLIQLDTSSKQARHQIEENKKKREQEEEEAKAKNIETAKESILFQTVSRGYSIKMNDRISQLGGYASAGAQAVSGFTAMTETQRAIKAAEKTAEEVEKQTAILEDINGNTKEGGATWQ